MVTHRYAYTYTPLWRSATSLSTLFIIVSGIVVVVVVVIIIIIIIIIILPRQQIRVTFVVVISHLYPHIQE